MARRARRSTEAVGVPETRTPPDINSDNSDAIDEGHVSEEPDESDADALSGDSAPVSIDFDFGAVEETTPASGTIYVTNGRDGVNLRSGPSADFSVIRSLPLGTRVHIVKREGRWGLVDEQGDGAADGFVHLAFLNEQPPIGLRAGSMISDDQVRAFWAGRNPRGARLYDRAGNALVDPRLLRASAAAAANLEGRIPNYRIEMYGPGGGLRSGGSTRNHTVQPGTGRGAAMDFVIIDRATGKMLTNHPGRAHQHQGTVGQNAPSYQSYYNEVVRAGSQLYLRFAEMARFGGYFASGDNAMDTMHIDMRGLEVPMAGGSLRSGFTREQMRRWDIRENRPYP